MVSGPPSRTIRSRASPSSPFYRLAGASDASPECRGAQWQEEVVSDAEAALDWVKLYGPLFGASTGGKVAVTGQSAVRISPGGSYPVPMTCRPACCTTAHRCTRYAHARPPRRSV